VIRRRRTSKIYPQRTGERACDGMLRPWRARRGWRPRRHSGVNGGGIPKATGTAPVSPLRSAGSERPSIPIHAGRPRRRNDAYDRIRGGTDGPGSSPIGSRALIAEESTRHRSAHPCRRLDQQRRSWTPSSHNTWTSTQQAPFGISHLGCDGADRVPSEVNLASNHPGQWKPDSLP
jgi:hypothetical protein